MKKILGLIPARGGSKGVPKKNIRLLGGKPLIAWTIEAARKSRLLSRVILSTDSEEIAAVGKKHGAEVPFMRPMELAGDDTPTIAVVKHCLDYLEKSEKYVPDAVVILQPTTPFRRSEDIDLAIEMFFQHDAGSVVSVSAVPAHYNPEWQLVPDKKGFLRTYSRKKLSTLKSRRQLLKDTYYRNGEIYVVSPKNILVRHVLYGDKTLPLITGGRVNIDCEEDFGYAEFLAGK